jgi:tRNA (guanine-N7-)-methyltransferase
MPPGERNATAATDATTDPSEPGFPGVDSGAFWSALFGNTAPVEIEIGAGDGTFLIAAAADAPDTNFLGIERSPAKARRLAARIVATARPSLRVLRADATCVLATVVPAASVSAYHVYFPDPWPKRRHARRRLFTTELVAALGRTLVPGGRLFTATDVEPYARRIRAAVLVDRRFEERACGPDHPGLTTAFARKYSAAGRTLHPAVFLRRAR